MKKIRLIAVGKLKTPFFQEAARHYGAAFGRYHELDLVEVRDAPAELSPEEKKEREGAAILAKVGPRDLVLCLDERGRALTSRGFAEELRKWVEDPSRTACLVIGGPWGLSGAVRERSSGSISLGPMTLPHELARVVLLEQLYRAATILKGLPYHHD